MENSITKLEKFNIKSLSKKTYIKQKAYLIALKEKNATKAKQLVVDDLKKYPQEAKDLILEKIDYLANKK